MEGFLQYLRRMGHKIKYDYGLKTRNFLETIYALSET